MTDEANISLSDRIQLTKRGETEFGNIHGLKEIISSS